MSAARSGALAEYLSWIVDRALPRWADSGFDRQQGRFRERLDLSGQPIDLPHRSMVQARQIFVFADACRRGWLPEGGALAEAAMDNLLKIYMRDDGRRTSFAFSASSGSAPGSEARDAYAHAFALFSLAALYSLNADDRLLDVADRTIVFVEEEMADHRHGGLHDALPPPVYGKRQNPHMHLLEAYLFLHGAAPDRGYLDRAGQIVTLFEQRFFDKDAGVLLEYFNEDWSTHDDAQRGRLWEPGHHFEWVWLLDRFASLTGTIRHPAADRLYEEAARHGLSESNLLFDELDSVGKHVVRGSSRLWPHTEAIKAAGTLNAKDPAAASALAEPMAAALLDNFLERPFSGGWIDHLAEDGSPLVDYVPASSLYHLYLAATEVNDVFLPGDVPV